MNTHQLKQQLTGFRDRFVHAASHYDGTFRQSRELERTIDDYSAFITDERHQRLWLSLEPETLYALRPMTDELRQASALCVAIMEKYRALKLLHEGDDRNQYFDHIQASIEKEFGSFRVSGDSCVLLVGSGSFPMTPLLIAQRTGAHVFGIDIDGEAVQLGRKVVQLLGGDLNIQLEHKPLEQFARIGEVTHVIFSSTVAVKYELLDWLHAAARPDIVAAIRYGDGLKSLFNYPSQDVDGRKWRLAETAALPGHVFDIALYRKVEAATVQGGGAA